MSLATIVSAVPRAIYAVLALALLTVGAIVALKVHDNNVRAAADAVRIEAQLDSTVNVLASDTAQLHAQVRRLDSLYASAQASVVRVAYVPQSLRDSIAALTHAIELAAARGDSTVPIVVAHGAAEHLVACRAQVDTLAAAAGTLASACAQRVAARDSTIHDDVLLLHAKDSTIAILKNGPGAATPRLSPYVAADYSLVRRRLDAELGARLRLFSGLNLRGSVGYRDSLDARVGAEYEFR